MGVRRAICAFPYGEIRAYGDIARALQTNAQAVGQACGANPLPILIPCHRVTGTHWFGGFSAPGGARQRPHCYATQGHCRCDAPPTATPRTGTYYPATARFWRSMQHTSFAHPSMAMPFKGARCPREWRPVAKSCITP